MNEIIAKKILGKENFSKLVEDFIVKNRIDTLEAVIHIAEENKIEIESIKGLLTKELVLRIEAESRDRNLLKREKKLPI